MAINEMNAHMMLNNNCDQPSDSNKVGKYPTMKETVKQSNEG